MSRATWVLAAALVVEACAGGQPAPVLPCATSRAAGARSGRFLVFATGHVRSFEEAAETLYTRVVLPSRPSRVDVFFLVWHDVGYGCEAEALGRGAAKYGFRVFYDPRHCDAYFNKAFHNSMNQWRMTHRALGLALSSLEGAPCGVDDRGMPCAETAALAEETYALIVRTRTDLIVSRDVDLDAVRREYAAKDEVKRANGHFVEILSCDKGADEFMIGTPALVIQHFISTFRGKWYDQGVIQHRLEDHGVTPTSWDPDLRAPPYCRGDFNIEFLRDMYASTRGSPRCAPLFAVNRGVHINRRNRCSPLAARTVTALQDGYCHASFQTSDTIDGQAPEASLTCPVLPGWRAGASLSLLRS